MVPRRDAVAGYLHVEAVVLEVADQRQAASDGVRLDRAQHLLGGLKDGRVAEGVQLASHTILALADPLEIDAAVEILVGKSVLGVGAVHRHVALAQLDQHVGIGVDVGDVGVNLGDHVFAVVERGKADVSLDGALRGQLVQRAGRARDLGRLQVGLLRKK